MKSVTIALCLVKLLFLAEHSWASVAFDAVGPSGGGGAGMAISSGLASPLTWTHTVTGTNTVLYIGIACGVQIAGHQSPNYDADCVITSVTYNGIAASLVPGSTVHANAAHQGFISLYRLVNPGTGSNTVSVSFTLANPGSGDAVAAGSISFTGVDQSVPDSSVTSATGNGTAPSVTIASAVGNMVLDLVQLGSSISSSTQTLGWMKNINNLSAGGNAAQSTAAGAASVTMSYAGTSDWWAIVGLNINQFVATGTPKVVTASWVADADVDLAGYYLYRFTGPCASLGTWVRVQNYALVTSGTDTLPDYGVYCYALSAFDLTGNESAKSAPVEFLYAFLQPTYQFRFGSRSMGFKQ